MGDGVANATGQKQIEKARRSRSLSGQALRLIARQQPGVRGEVAETPVARACR